MIKKLFVFEALSLVLSSAILGSLVGIALAMLIGFLSYYLNFINYKKKKSDLNLFIYWARSKILISDNFFSDSFGRGDIECDCVAFKGFDRDFKDLNFGYFKRYQMNWIIF